MTENLPNARSAGPETAGLLTRSLPSPFGPLCVSARDGAIVALDWKAAPREDRSALLEEAAQQMKAYFDGTLRSFDLPLAPAGDKFQQSVCAAMLAIPYGETRTYGDIARDLETYGQPVGQACGANTIPIIIPCHRVLATGGLGGYSGEGGVERKIALLKHEGGYPYLL